MFGYVTPYKSELKIKDYNTFRAYYCGLCKTLGSQYNHMVRMGLNYDLSFLSLLLSSIEDKQDEVKVENCIAHPIAKRMIIGENRSLKYTSSISVMLVYFKLIDDWKDDKSVKALVGNIPFKMSIEKARKENPQIFDFIKEKLEEISVLEREKCNQVDEVASAFGQLMEKIAAPDFIEDEETKRILNFLGYNLGRWIYILDAFDDIKSDSKTGNYNPLILEYGYSKGDDIDAFIKKVKESIELPLTFTLENVSKSFELLKIVYNREIIENIIYLGMRSKMEQVFNRGGQKDEQSI